MKQLDDTTNSTEISSNIYNQPQEIPEHTSPNPQSKQQQQQLLRGTADLQNENSSLKPVLRGSTDFQNENSPSKPVLRGSTDEMSPSKSLFRGSADLQNETSPSKSLFRGSADLQNPNSPSKSLFRGSANSNENSQSHKHQLLRGTTELQNLGLDEEQAKGRKIFFILGKCQICHFEVHDVYTHLSLAYKTSKNVTNVTNFQKILQVYNPLQKYSYCSTKFEF